MMWLISNILMLIGFAGTLLFLRFTGNLLRRFVSPDKTADWSNLKFSIVFVIPTLVFGIFLLILKNRFGVILISSAAVWASLIWDALHLLCALNFVRKLSDLRRKPNLFFHQVKLAPHKHPAKSNIGEISPFRFWLRGFSLPSSLQIFSKVFSGSNCINVTQGDFNTTLRQDIRLIDSFEDVGNRLNLTIPHLEKIEGISIPNKFFLVNRIINTALPDELWKTSCRLIQKTPTIIAATWKTYHFQEDVRLRFVTLFNSADLIQRLLGAIILQIVAASGELRILTERDDFPRNRNNQILSPPNTGGEWNRVLVWVLRNSKNAELDIFRRMLLETQPDFSESVEKLAPFWKILQTSPQIPPDEQHILACFSILAQLRNKTVGHGAIGWKFQLRPAIYLSSLHYFFLNTMRKISQLDAGVFAYRKTEEELKIIALIQGLKTPAEVPGDFGVGIKNPANGNNLNLFPFLRFYNGRLLIADSFSKDFVIYTDFNTKNIAEPSFIKLKNT